MLAAAALFNLGQGVLRPTMPLYLVKRGGVGPDAVGFIVSLSVLGRLLALWLGGGISDRWGRLRVLIPGLVIYAALLGSLTFLTHPLVLGLWRLAIGGATGLVAALPTAGARGGTREGEGLCPRRGFDHIVLPG